MKYTIVIYIVLISNFCKGQKVQGEISLDKNISLEWVCENFKPEDHKIKYCTESNDKYICLIDNKPWYGSDLGVEFPRNQLTKLTLKINSKKIDLDINNMFNASYDCGLSTKQFKLKKEGSFYKLYGFFSDGAGTYTAHWKITDASSVREVISKDEEYFGWQNEH